ncbi:MAG: helix-turn-helix domain-containing protein [Anaerolineales bacterium]
MSPLHIPSPPLNTYIENLYYVDGLMPYRREKILPDSRLDLKINFGGAIQANKADHTGPVASCSESWGVGLWSESHIVDWPLDMGFFGVSFKPAGAYPFLKIPLSELHNQVVPLDALWGSCAAEIRERLYAEPTIQARFALLEEYLLARLCEAPHGIIAVHFALTQIARCHGVLSIRALSEQMGISQNHLGTQFKRLVGGTPKELARLYRFEHAIRSIDPAQPVDWTQVAYQHCYYDQSHFNKDFVEFTGHNPTEYLRLRRRVQTENPQHAQYLRLLPID